MTAPRPRWFEDVTVGEALPPLEFDVTLTSLVMYAGATWDFHRYHYDRRSWPSSECPRRSWMARWSVR